MEIEKVHPELRVATRRLPVPDASIRLARAAVRLMTRILPVPRTDSVRVSSVRSAGLRFRVYRPQTPRRRGGLLWFHGGGLLYGDARQDEALCAGTARDLGITVVSANYRFAPEHPFPAAHDDVHTAWRWVLANAAALGIDPARVVIGGESAGAGLAAALVQRIHDDGGGQPIAQWLFAPMIDDRTAADTSLDAVDHWVWNNRANRIGWGGYLLGVAVVVNWIWDSQVHDHPGRALPARAHARGGRERLAARRRGGGHHFPHAAERGQ